MRTFHIFEEILKSFREQNYFRQRLVEQTFPEEKWSGSNIYNAISLCLSVCLSVYLSMALVLWLMVRFSNPLQRLSRISSVVQIYSTVGVLVPEYWTQSLLTRQPSSWSVLTYLSSQDMTKYLHTFFPSLKLDILQIFYQERNDCRVVHLLWHLSCSENGMDWSLIINQDK